VNSKRKTKTGVSELHDKSESGTFIASSDDDKAEILANFFSSVFTDEDVNNLPKMEKRNSDIATLAQYASQTYCSVIDANFLSSFLNSAVIIATFQFSGTISVSNDFLKIMNKGLSITFANSYSTFGCALDKFNQFSDKQFGFMGGRSTSLQLLKVLDKWTSVLDEGGVLNAVYMDFMKAFDKVPHTRLLVKMKAYGTIC
jgi:hypothetical protein